MGAVNSSCSNCSERRDALAELGDADCQAIRQISTNSHAGICSDAKDASPICADMEGACDPTPPVVGDAAPAADDLPVPAEVDLHALKAPVALSSFAPPDAGGLLDTAPPPTLSTPAAPDADGLPAGITSPAPSEKKAAPAKARRVSTKAKAPIGETKAKAPEPPMEAEVKPEKPKYTKDQKALLKKLGKKKSYLQEAKDRKADFEANKEKNMKLVDDIMAGKYNTEGQGQPKGGDMRIHMPTPADRANTRTMILGQFRAQFAKIGRNNQYCPSAAAPEKSAAAPAINSYTTAETQALQIVGGHTPIPRPDNVQLPKDYRKPVGIITLQTLAEFGSGSDRKLCSVYGDIFDVSDRPDKYGTDGPYEWMCGNDITWGFVSGKDVPETVNRCYDLWKVAPETFRDSKFKLIYAWVAFYEYEYGDAVGKLDLYDNEAGLKGPPMEESQDCSIM